VYRSATFGLLCVAIAASAAGAQNVVLRVRVTDSTNKPVAGAELSVVRGLREVLATAVADSDGRRTLSVRLDTGSFELVGRRIGYTRGSRFFTPIRGDTLSLTLRMSRIPQELAAIHITAAEDIKRKRLFIDADAIAGSERPIFDGLDVVTKLRPDMVYGLGGRGHCPPMQEIWVNGKRIYWQQVPVDAMSLARARGTPAQPIARHALAVLMTIHPEHIAEMTYHDCADMSVGKIGGENALFVVLKPGIAYDVRRGSYLEDLMPLALRPPPVPASLDSIRSAGGTYRLRLLGVYDGETGAPLDSCSVVETSSGTRARTTSSGTVSLAFLPEGVSTLRVERPGYSSLTFDVSISPRDTAPITVVLKKTPPP
jgi:hypothetical protein